MEHAMKVKLEKEKEKEVLVPKKAANKKPSKNATSVFEAYASLSESSLNFQTPIRKARKEVKGNFCFSLLVLILLL